MNDWKTTISGLVAAIGTYLSSSQTGVLQVIGQVLSALGLLLLGKHAADSKMKL